MKLVIRNMSFPRESISQQDQLTILNERVASLIELNAILMRKEKNLEDAKERVRFLNSDLFNDLETKANDFDAFEQTLGVGYSCLNYIELQIISQSTSIKNESIIIDVIKNYILLTNNVCYSSSNRYSEHASKLKSRENSPYSR